MNIQCSFSKQQLHVHASMGKLMEIHLAPSHNAERVCQVRYVYNMFLSIDYTCKGNWGWKVFLGQGPELHQYKFLFLKHPFFS